MAGRKPTLTKQIVKDLISILEAGNYQRTAYEAIGVPERTYFSWIEQGEKAEVKLEEGKKLTANEETFMQFSRAIKKAVQAARQRNLQVVQDATEGGQVISEQEFYDKKGNVTSKKTVYSVPSWQAAAWYLERTSPAEFGQRVKQEIEVPKDIKIRVVYDE